MKRYGGVRWRYRTILFEFNKDTVFGDKYIDEEEVEKTLNEEGAQGWELVNVTLLREGLLAFCKKPEQVEEKEQPARLELEAPDSSVSDGPRVLKKSELIARYPAEEEQAPRPDSENERVAPGPGTEDSFGEIKIR